MRIVIIGAGKTGSEVALAASAAGHEVAVTDLRRGQLRRLVEHADVRTVIGNGSYPNTLYDAGAEDADVLLAVTDSDETNLVACEIARKLFRTRRCVARVRAAGYFRNPALFTTGVVSIDAVISPEEMVVVALERLVEHPGALEVIDLLGGAIQLTAVRAHRGGRLVGKPLRTFAEPTLLGDAPLVALYRGKQSHGIAADTVVESDDEVYFLARPRDVLAIITGLHGSAAPDRKIVISGGGAIGSALAARIEPRFQVKVIERDARCSAALSERLHRAIVLNANAEEEDLLLDERIHDTDLFCALTDDDTSNILTSMLAKRLGARRVATLVNRPNHTELLENGVVDIVVCPLELTVSALLAQVHGNGAMVVHRLHRRSAALVEIVVDDHRRSSVIARHSLDALTLPDGARIVALARGGEAVSPRPGMVVERGDGVLIFLEDARRLAHIERLFHAPGAFD